MIASARISEKPSKRLPLMFNNFASYDIDTSPLLASNAETADWFQDFYNIDEWVDKNFDKIEKIIK